MTLTLAPTAASLYAAILREPDRDDHRLVFADALDDDGQHELAEFVRVQVELARLGDASHRVCKLNQDCASGDCAYCHKDYLKARESALLRQHGDGWRRGEVCERCKDDRGWEMKHHGKVQWTGCPKCRGTGYTSPLAMRPSAMPGMGIGHKVGWSRGLITSYHATHAEVFTDDGPSEWACEVSRAFPIQEIRLTTHPAWQQRANEGWIIGGDGASHPFLHHGIVGMAYQLASVDGIDRFESRELAEHYQALAVATVVRQWAFKEKR